MVERIILHIDFDSFFASVEQQYNPKLRGKPIGVTATNGRTCVIAASREAKRFGIKTGTRTWEAEKRCKEFLAVPADFTKYWEVSKQFIRICTFYTPYVEVFSIDEVFMDVTQTAELFGGVDHLIMLLKRRIMTEIGLYITVSVGISHNKLLAKLASGMQKPNGVVTITKAMVPALYKKLPLTEICGIGERISDRLHNLGIHMVSDLSSASLLFLQASFGNVCGKFLYDVGQGRDDRPLQLYTTQHDAKSVSRNYCLPKNEYEQRVILQNIFELSEEIGIKLRRLGKKAKTVGLSLRGTRSKSGRKTAVHYFNSGQEIFSYCYEFYKVWGWQTNPDPKNQMVRMISVWVGNLIDTKKVPLTLFDQDEKSEKRVQIIDAINKKFGDHTIRNGFLLYSQKLTTVPNGFLADTYERKLLAG